MQYLPVLLVLMESEFTPEASLLRINGKGSETCLYRKYKQKMNLELRPTPHFSFPTFKNVYQWNFTTPTGT